MDQAPAVLGAGRVGRAHGLDGSFYVTGARSALLSVGTVVVVAGRNVTIVRRAGTEARPIVRLEGVDDRSGADELRGQELMVRADQAPALGEGEWWAHELEGCEVVDRGRRVGTVTRLIELPSCEALEVQPLDGGESLLVPMVKDAIRSVEVGRERIEVDLEFLGLEARAGARAAESGESSGR
jgi:16S rRNA processing protein RimM